MFATALQKAIAPTGQMSWAEAFLVSSAALALALPVVAVAYFVKSALGINLMDGPSPVHDLLYQLVR